MKNRRHYIISFVFLVLLIVELAGCAAGAASENSSEEDLDKAEWIERTVWEDVAAVVKGAGETADFTEQRVTLAVTDLRINTPVVREYADKEAFLYEYDFDGQEPYFEYFTEDGALQLELYYDEYCGVGCGLRYYPGEDWEPEGFLFNGACNYRYYTDFMDSGGIETDRYSSRQSHYDEGERLIYEHCYVTHGSVDYYYIYEEESEIPAYCLIIDHNTGLLCAELLEYHGTGAGAQGTGVMVQGAETGMYYGRVGPMLAGESENRYAAAVIEAAVKEGENCDGYITHTYAADYDGDSLEEAFVIYGKEIKDEYEHYIGGSCFFVNSDLEVSLCIDRAIEFDLSQQFICQDGVTYLVICYAIGFTTWQAEMYTVQDNAAVEISDSYANKYVDRQGHVLQIENAYDGQCTLMNVGVNPGEDNWKYLWSGHSWKTYTFILDHGELREVPAREVTRKEVEQIAPLPASFDEIAPDSIKQFILRDNGELNINMAVESEWGEEKNIDFSYITYRLNEDGQWEYVEEQMGYYEIQFSGGERWNYVEELYQR